MGSRTVERILPETTPGELFQKHIHYILIGDEFFWLAKDRNIEGWLNDYDGQLIDQMTYYYGPAGPIRTLYLVRLLHD
ncbi:MAG TPA: hypothetical protein VGY56_15560 [Verrucomicrobiae bacterium]|nr:hypothetical protein [Verrucomicrobiae bacterium]